MNRNSDLEKRIFNISTPDEFNACALEIFRFQYAHNKVYAEFVDLLRLDLKSISEVEDIPHLPIEFFKSHQVIAQNSEFEKIFKSSGTTGSLRSQHFVSHLDLYKQSFLEGFRYFYRDPRNYRVLALLPSYQEQGDSSLVFMVEELIRQSNSEQSGFFLNDEKGLKNVLLSDSDLPTLLIGVSYALIDFCEKHPLDLPNLIVMETGGMKGRRKEMTRSELHKILRHGFGVNEIHSEYGMTELLSQAYAAKEGAFHCPPWMRLNIRDVNDPLKIETKQRTGGINIIDLANLYSCSFIATSDLGRKLANGGTEILGRFDYSDIRGCNLMISDLKQA